MHADENRPHVRAIPAAICVGTTDRLGHVRRRREGPARNGTLAAAVAEDPRLCNRAHRQMAPRIQARVQSKRARIRLLLRIQERIHRLLPSRFRRRPARPVRERPGRRRAGLHDGSHHRAVCWFHRAERTAAVLHRRVLQRRALAVPAAGRAVQGARQRPASRPVRRGDEHARRLRRDARARGFRCRPDSRRRSTSWACDRTRS